MEPNYFEIRDVSDLDLTGFTLIECFPSISALALITGNIILESGNSTIAFDQVAVGDSNQLPASLLFVWSIIVNLSFLFVFMQVIN
jgi:hypothetical protein